jgi:uncharacterized peroxidase-related enzyme
VAHHGGALRGITRDDDLVKQLSRDYRDADITEPDLVMLRYVEKLTSDPGSITEGDIQSLKNAGFGDGEILRICQVAAYFAFVNRLASGLGVELEESVVTARKEAT